MRPRFRTCSWWILATVVLIATAPRPAAAQFSLRVNLTVGSGGKFVLMRDVNVDGKLDVLALNQTSNTVSVLLGNGIGGFSPKSDVALVPGAIANAIALGDINGDARPDLAVANVGTQTVSVFLGDGAGGFGARTDYATGGTTLDVDLADMTGDGRLDLVVSAGNFQHIGIFPGNGAGGFGPPRDFFGTISPETATGDFNGDGRLDLCILIFSPSSVAVLLADGAGGFQSRVNYATTNGSDGMALGDVNGDGKLDVVTTSQTGATVSVLLGDGTGALGAKIDYAAQPGVRRPLIGDFTGDGLADLAVACNSPFFVGAMVGNGAGAFSALGLNSAASNTGGLAAGDVNGDGRLDLVSLGSTTASLMLNGSGGQFRPARTDIPVGAAPRYVTTGDINGDGRLDLAVANSGANTVSVLLGTAAGGLGARNDFAVGAVPTGVAIGDVSGDGRADLVVTNSQAATVSLLRGNGAGGFDPKIDFAVGAGPVSVVLGDFSGQGRLDAAVADNIASTLSVLPNNGAGGFGAKTDYVTGANPASVAAGDVNADGRPDLVVSNGSSNSASVFLATGNGAFGAKTDFTTGPTPLELRLGDANGDGVLDILVANSGTNTVSILLGNGTGGFGTKSDVPISGNPVTLAIGDVNGDGRLDFVTNGSQPAVWLNLGNGAGGFNPGAFLSVADGPQSIAIGDLNGDGRPDLAVSGINANAVSVLLGLVPTKTTLSVSASPVVAGFPMVLNATVSVPAPGLGTPADSVRFFDGTTLLGTSPVNGGAAGLALFAPYRGDRSITAVYKGDGKLLGSISNIVTPRVVATAAASITDIADVAGDQGGQAVLSFARSPFDYLGSGIAITGYQVYRRAIIADALEGSLPEMESDPTAVQLAGWQYVLTVPATTDDVYEAVVPTLADSNGTGINRAVLFVRATTASPGVYYDSPADSGYSIDNLAPAAPSPLTAVYSGGATHLHWGQNGEHDFASYRVYRGASAGFVPGAGNLLASPPDTGYADAGAPGSYYKVSAVDVNGNQSLFALVGPDATTDVAPSGTTAFALERVRPNPATVSRLMISFSLPTAAPARLEVFDVRGRRVAAQDVGGRGAGRQAVPLSSAQLSPGVYLVKLSQGAASMTQRMTVVE